MLSESITSLYTARMLNRAKTVLQEGLTRAKTVSSSCVWAPAKFSLYPILENVGAFKRVIVLRPDYKEI